MAANKFTQFLSAVCVTALFSVNATAQKNALPTESLITWTTDYHAGFDQAVLESKPMLIDFYADWCGPCKMMDAQTYSDPRVIKALGDFVTVKVDTDRDQTTAFAYRIRGIPRTVVLNIHGEMVGDIVGFMDANEFLGFLSDTKKDALKKVDGVIIVVPKQDPVAADPASAFTSTTALDDLKGYLSDVDPAIRKAAQAELLKRDEKLVHEILLEMLRNEYLGSRIAAWETMSAMAKLDKTAFDPWEAETKRNEMLAGILNTIKY